MHGRDLGAGVEAAELMQAHVEKRHARTWPEFLTHDEQRCFVPGRYCTKGCAAEQFSDCPQKDLPPLLK